MKKDFKGSVLLTGILSGLVFFTVSANAIELPNIVKQPSEGIPGTKPEIQIQLPAKLPAVTSKKIPSLPIKNISFRGGSIFSLKQLAKWTKPIIGKQASKVELVRLLRRITKQYQQAGYPLSYAMLPKQNYRDGSIEIFLIEGYIARSEIEVPDSAIKQRVMGLIQHLVGETPLKQASFERYVTLLKNTPGVQFKIQVPKPKTISGATTIKVTQIKRDWYQTHAGLDDGQSQNTNLYAALALQSLSQAADKTTLSTLLPNDSIDNYYALDFQRDIGTQGLRLQFNANQYKSSGQDRIYVTDIPVDLEEQKKRSQLQLGVSYPLTLRFKQSWWIGGQLQHIREDSAYRLEVQNGNASHIEKILHYSALRLYSRWSRQTLKSSLSAQVNYQRGLNLGDSQNEINQSDASSHGSEDLNFNVLSTQLGWRYDLTEFWRLQSRMDVTWSNDILPVVARVSYGGQHFGRAYPDSQAQGDKGMAADIQISYLKPVAYHWLKLIQPYIVVDGAQTRFNSSALRQTLATAAVGVGLSDSKYYSLSFEYARPLADKNINSNNRSGIFNLHLRWQF